MPPASEKKLEYTGPAEKERVAPVQQYEQLARTLSREGKQSESP